MESLQTEIATYKNRLHDLLEDEGKFVVIHEEKILGIFSSYEDALTAGYAARGLDAFLVKRISAIDPINFSSRLQRSAN